MLLTENNFKFFTKKESAIDESEIGEMFEILNMLNNEKLDIYIGLI